MRACSQCRHALNVNLARKRVSPPPSEPAPIPPTSLSSPPTTPTPSSVEPDVSKPRKIMKERWVLNDSRIPVKAQLKTRFVRREGQWTIDASSPWPPSRSPTLPTTCRLPGGRHRQISNLYIVIFNYRTFVYLFRIWKWHHFFLFQWHLPLRSCRMSLKRLWAWQVLIV